MIRDPYEAALDAVGRLAARGDIAVFGNDIDLTLSAGGRQGADDPRQTTIREDSGAALRALEERGHIVGVITNRSGRQAARLLAERGVRAAEIVGTYGLETFHADASDPALGRATIDGRFAPYARPITAVLRAVREALYQDREGGPHEEPADAVEVAIPTPSGPILLERKAVCDEFPEGLAHVYNFNLVRDRGARERYVARLEEGYGAAARGAATAAGLGRVWGVAPAETTPRDERYSWAVEPLLKHGKAYGMVTLLRAIRRRRAEGPRIGLIAFAGDSDADAAAMRAAHLAVACARGARPEAPLGALGIWVRPEGKDAPLARRRADLAVDGPEGYARLLTRMAEVASV